MRSGSVIKIVEVCLLFAASSCQSQDYAGCTDPLANNYDPGAAINDGSCTYDPVSISPQQTFSLNDLIKRTSGLILWDGNLWTFNDHEDIMLYGLDTITADIERMYPITRVVNYDWEEISQDQEFIYIGDFGNNTGNRTDLHILCIDKNSLIAGNADIDTIWFSYEDQTDFSTKEAYQTDFDCEAMIVSDDSIYLFTKQWISTQTSIYKLPKTSGNHTAVKKYSYDVQGLVTGATYLENKNLVVLCGYTNLLQPFLTLLYDFRDCDFLSGNRRIVNISLPFHQVEGISTLNGLRYFISNEAFSLEEVIYNPQKLHIVDLSSLLMDYLFGGSFNIQDNQLHRTVLIYPNPVSDEIIVKIDKELSPVNYEIYDQSARIVSEGILTDEVSTLNISQLPAGLFTFQIGRHHQSYRFLRYCP